MASSLHAEIRHQLTCLVREIGVCSQCEGAGLIPVSWDSVVVDECVCDGCAGFGVTNVVAAERVLEVLKQRREVIAARQVIRAFSAEIEN